MYTINYLYVKFKQNLCAVNYSGDLNVHLDLFIHSSNNAQNINNLVFFKVDE